MNKIKVIYDVVRKMKDRDSIKGAVKVEGLKDQAKILEISSVFEKTSQSFQTKGKTIIEVDSDGKKMKLENNIDFQKEGCCEHQHFHHLHSAHTGRMKGGLSRITAILGIVSSIQLEEKEDGSAILSLESANIPEEVKSDIHEMMKNGHEQHKHMESNHQHHICMNEFHNMEDMKFTLNVVINKSKEIDRVTVDLKGEKKDEKGGSNQMKLAAELSFE